PEHGWVAYNGLQLLTYFITVFVAAPLAMITGLGMSPALSTRLGTISKIFSIQLARSLHALVIVWFVVLIVMLVPFVLISSMVLMTAAVPNRNMMFAARDSDGPLGVLIFGVALAIIITAWLWASPFTIRHPRFIQRAGDMVVGPIQRRLEKLRVTPGTYAEKD